MADQIAYRGQARERGFNPIQLSTAGVDAILQQGAGLSRQLRENQQIEETNRNRFQAGKEAADSLEAANRKSNFELSESSRAAYQDAVNQNLRTRIRDSESAFRNQAADPAMPLLESLSKFSNTLFKQIAEAKAAKREQEQLQGYVDEYIGGPMPQDAALVQEGVVQLRKQDEVIQSTADKMQDTGAQPETVEAVRKLSKYYLLGRTMARADMAVPAWTRYLEQAYEKDKTQVQYQDVATGEMKIITPMDAQGPDELAAVNTVLLRRFIREQGLIELDPKFLSKTLKAMREGEDKLLDREQGLFDKARDKERRSETLMQLDGALAAGRDPVEALQESMRLLTHQRDEEGRIRPLRAFEIVVGHLVTNGNMEALSALEASEGYQPGKTWGELRAATFTKARRDITTQKASDEDLEDKVSTQKQEDWSDEIITTLNSIEGGADAAQVDEVIAASRRNFNGKVDPRILQYRENMTFQARTLEESRQNLEELASQGELTIEELNSGKYSFKLRNDPNFRRAAEEGTRRTEAINKGLRDQFKGGITAALLANAKITGTTNVKPASFYFAEAHALRKMDSLATTYMAAGKTPEEAYQQAARDIAAQVEADREEVTGKKKGGPYSFNDGEFGLFSSKANFKGQADIAQKDVADKVRRVRQGGVTVVAKEKLIPLHILEATTSLSAPVPLIATVIANALPPGKNMSPYDVINAQRALYGLPPRQPDVATLEIENTGDPRLRELINRVPTAARSSRAVLGAGMVGPGQDRQAISMIATQLGVNPADVATVINYETGGNLVSGQFRRGLDRWGGDGGQYLGWIQFSPENQKKFGVRPGMSPEQMAQSVVGYLKASGVRPGDPLHVIYQAIQAPRYTDQARATGRNYLSDSNGAVSTHVARMQKEHRPLAEGWLRQGGGVGGGSPYRDPRLLSAPAKRLLSQAQVTSGVGFRVHPVTGGRKFHAGVDYGVDSGTKLSLKQPGVIVDIQDHGASGYGKYVDVQFPDGSVGRFAHLSKVKVKMGQTISPKQVFALTGNTGGSTGPHLHLEKRVGDRPVDPRSLANQVYADI